MVNEVVDNLLLLAILDPQNMTGFEVYDMRGISATIMEFEFIDAKVSCLLLKLNELLATISGIELLETLFVNRLYDVFVETGDLCDLFIGIGASRKKIPGVLIQCRCDTMSFCFERNELAFGFLTMRTA